MIPKYHNITTLPHVTHIHPLGQVGGIGIFLITEKLKFSENRNRQRTNNSSKRQQHPAAHQHTHTQAHSKGPGTAEKNLSFEIRSELKFIRSEERREDRRGCSSSYSIGRAVEYKASGRI